MVLFIKHAIMNAKMLTVNDCYLYVAFILLLGFLYFLVYWCTGMENVGNDRQYADGYDCWEGIRHQAAV